MEEIIGHFVNAALAYAAFGLLFGAAFVWRGVGKIDANAREGSWGFRLAILPGVAALWPLMLRRWLSAKAPPVERNSHRNAAGGRTR